jgi:glycerate kinase
MHILIAPNAFKNSINAIDAARAIESGLQQSNLNCSTECFPIADGGDGTGTLIIDKCNGRRIYAEVQDPLGRKITTAFGVIEGGQTAIIEMADSSGLRLLKTNELNPIKATSYGTGELISLALDKGIKKIVIAMGGSATVDGGAGILSALGVRFLNRDGQDISRLTEKLIELDRIDITGLDERIKHSELTILCDVDNELLGPTGAAAVFGPQKGAGPEEVEKLELRLKKMAEIVFVQTGKGMATVKYGGTAGGAAAGLYACLNAKLVNGIKYFLELTNFNEALGRANLVITGEGSLDVQTLQGKGPFGVALAAKKKNLPVIGIAGKIPLQAQALMHEYFDILLSICNEPLDLPNALAYTQENLMRTSKETGNLLAAGQLINNKLV